MNAKIKPNLLLLHGAIGSKTQFEPWIPVLNPYYNCYILDFEGHGQNNTNSEFSIQRFATQVIQYIKAEITQPVNVFGYSMGGYVGLYIAQHYHGIIDKLFTFATKLDWNAETAQKEVKMLNPAIIRQKVPKFADELQKRHEGIGWENVLFKTAEMMLKLGQSPLVTVQTVKSIDIPVQMGVGDKDTMVSIEESISICRNIAKSSFCVLPNTLHPIEKIDIHFLLPLIRKFFDE
ncbi:MAG: alpha/beta fold hydrolase [Bacteroidia bacterium]|nr:alpha/beta fold hydrolase [Bacteroidia bacterium]MDW8347176.1 alpha/beta fold hydrolase [Bacteroidia bacterium]